MIAVRTLLAGWIPSSSWRATMVVRARVEIGNAHSYDILTFYVHNPVARDSALKLILLADSHSTSRSDAFRTSTSRSPAFTAARVSPETFPARSVRSVRSSVNSEHRSDESTS